MTTFRLASIDAQRSPAIRASISVGAEGLAATASREPVCRSSSTISLGVVRFRRVPGGVPYLRAIASRSASRAARGPYGVKTSPGAAAARRWTHSGAVSPRRRLVASFNRAAAISAADALMGRSKALGSSMFALARVDTHSGTRLRSLRLVTSIKRAAATSAVLAAGSDVRDGASTGSSSKGTPPIYERAVMGTVLRHGSYPEVESPRSTVGRRARKDSRLSDPRRSSEVAAELDARGNSVLVGARRFGCTERRTIWSRTCAVRGPSAGRNPARTIGK